MIGDIRDINGSDWEVEEWEKWEGMDWELESELDLYDKKKEINVL